MDEPLVTRSGRTMTDDEVEALADEAERGYDVSHLAIAPDRRSALKSSASPADRTP